MTNEVNTSRRRFLAASTAAVGGVGLVGVAVPFLGSWNPSAKAKAAGAPVTADISKIKSGEMITVEWRGKPIYVVNRTASQLEHLEGLDSQVRDPMSEVPQQPAYVSGRDRSIKPNFGIFIGLCTHLGCAPKFRPDVAPADLGADWLGGFFCPCHGSKFDLSGRVYKGVPAPTNLEVPPHRYVTDTIIIVGEDEGSV